MAAYVGTAQDGFAVRSLKILLIKNKNITDYREPNGSLCGDSPGWFCCEEP